MTVSAETNKATYAGDGSTTTYSTVFTFASNDEVTVTKVVTATGVETEYTLGTEYTLTGAGTGSAGTVTIATSPSDFRPASGTKLVIQLKPDFTQTTDLPRGGTVSPADTLEPMHDSRVRQMLRLKDDVDRSLKLPIDETSAAVLQNSSLRAGKILSFDSSTGAPITTEEFGTFRGNWAASTAFVARDLVKDTSTGNVFQCNTAHTSSGAQPLTTNTDSAKWDLIVDTATVTTQTTAAASSATAAAASSTSATTAKTAAETAKTAAETAQAAAETAKVSAENEASATAPKYSFSTSTSVADPGAGVARLNNSTASSSTILILDDQTADTGNPNVEDWLKTFDDSTNTIKGWVRLVEAGTPANFAIFNVTGITDSSGFIQVAVSHVDSNFASGTTFGNAAGLRLFFSRAGDKGDTGAQGIAGSAAGTLEYEFDTSTTDSDPGAGKLRCDHAVALNINNIFVDHQSNAAGNPVVQTFLTTFDDSTSTVKGTLTISAKDTPATQYLIFNVTGITDVGSLTGYTKIAVDHVANAGGIFSAGEDLLVDFRRSGDLGTTGSTGPTGTAATIAIGSVTTGAAGSSATVANAGSSSAATLNFSIPRGDTGATGPQGPAGGGMTDPMTTRGDIIVRNSSNATSRLPVGGASTLLSSDGTDISWGKTIGTGANNLVALNGSGALPAVSGANLTNLPVEDSSSDVRALALQIAADRVGFGALSGIADPFSDTTDIDATNSTNEVHNSTDKMIMGLNSTATDMGFDNLNSNSSNNQNYTYRVEFPASEISTDGGQFAVTLRAGDTEPCLIDEIYVGEKASSGNAWDFASTPTQLFKDGAAQIEVPINSTVQTDFATVTIDSSKGLIVSFDITGNSAKDYSIQRSHTGVNSWYKQGDLDGDVNEAKTVAPSSFRTNNNNRVNVDDIHIKPFADLALVSNFFATGTGGSAPTKASITIQVKENESITLNTDLVAQWSFDKSTFQTVTLALANALSVGGTKVYEAKDVTISSAGTYSEGNGICYKVSTANTKNVEIHGVSLSWS